MSSDYSYKYKPTGKYTNDIVEWFKNQKNKADSLTLLIRQAQNKYGNQDLVDMTTQAFLDDKLMIQKPTKPVSTEPTYSNEPKETEPEVKPEETQPVDEEELDDEIQEEPTTKSSNRKKRTVTHTNPRFKEKQKPNLGLLHKNNN